MRQIGSALDVAILGSILWSTYRGQIGPYLTGPPASARGDAAESLSATLSAAKADHATVEAAHAAVIHAMHTTTLVATAICVLGILGALAAIRTEQTATTGAPPTEHAPRGVDID